MHPNRALRQYQKVNSHAQISEASPHRLVQMLMEGGLDRMAQAKGALARGDIAQKGLMLGKAVDIIIGLRDGLDAEKSADPAYVHQLESLYAYMTNRLIEANLNSDEKIITVQVGLDQTISHVRIQTNRLIEANLNSDEKIIDEVAQLLITVKQGWDAIGNQQPAA